MAPSRSRGSRRPGRLVVAGFSVVAVVGAVLLMLPVSTQHGSSTTPLTALFTSVSAVCVTGLIVVDTPTYWSHFGQGVILALIQVGGFGTMTFASLLGLLVTRRLGMQARLTAAAETKSVSLGDVREVLVNVARTTVVIEVVVALALGLRFATAYDEPPLRALWLGVFHSVSAFNNAGFALFPDSLEQFVTDPWICLPVAFAVVLGGLGFPVILELRREWRRGRLTTRHWSLHLRLVLTATVVLVVLGWGYILGYEWSNPRTLGDLDVGGKLLASFFNGVMPRTAGFDSVPIGDMNESTLLGIVAMMFVGGGPAGTAGGIKVTTAALLAVAVWSEVRGIEEVHVFHRRVSAATIRQAFTVAALSTVLVVVASVTLLTFVPRSTHEVIFEVVSAFGTVGLSTGITDALGPPGQLIVIAMMFLGRLGPVTLVSALALRDRSRHFRYPEGRPLIG